MAGHSKWANIQHRKGAQDKKRAKIFTKLIKEITVAARMGGSDMKANPKLRLAVDKALKGNMPRDTVERAVKKGAGELEGVNYEECRYEGYGPAGIAVMCDGMTDNKNRTVAEVRHAFTKHNGNLGTDGSVAYLFSKIGMISYPPESDEDAIMDAALEAGAEDVVTNEDGSIDVITTEDDYMSVQDAMIAAGFETDLAELTMKASLEVELSVEDGQKMIKLIDRLEDLEDVSDVYTNAVIPEASYEEE
jgi:YebC/PmpR family DNA-binding regulatory protein